MSNPPRSGPATDRAERLAAALRENLRRRKQQGRSAPKPAAAPDMGRQDERPGDDPGATD